jgi:hypothetical protein
MLKLRLATVPRLPLNLVAYVFHGVTEFATSAAEAFLYASRRFICDTFVVKLLIVGEIARGLLNFSLELLGFAIDLVFIHR